MGLRARNRSAQAYRRRSSLRTRRRSSNSSSKLIRRCRYHRLRARMWRRQSRAQPTGSSTQIAQIAASKVPRFLSIVAEAANLEQCAEDGRAPLVVERFAQGRSRQLDVGQWDARPLLDQPPHPPSSHRRHVRTAGPASCQAPPLTARAAIVWLVGAVWVGSHACLPSSVTGCPERRRWRAPSRSPGALRGHAQTRGTSC
jgi:hypothetical protein